MLPNSIQLRLFITFLYCISCLSSFPQNYLSKYSNNVGIIEFYDSSKSPVEKHFGTGTLIYKSKTANSGNLYIVTTKHCIPNYRQCENIYFKIKSNDNSGFRTVVIPVFDNTGNYTKLFTFGKNGADIALINFNSIHDMGHFEYLDSSLIFSSILATKDTLLKYQISIGKELYFLGYPSIFYDKRNVSPIVRSGIIASNPSEDFYFNDDFRNAHYKRFKEWLPEEFNGFLIDANVFGGSSGSLVILKPNPLPFIENGKPIPPIYVPFIVGILSDSYFDLVALDPGHARLNLGGVISSNLIAETIDSIP